VSAVQSASGALGAGGPDGGSGEDVTRELARVADRLRVVGPRLAARDTSEAEATLSGVREALQALADIGAQAEARQPGAVPRLAPHALADQVLVLGHDVLAAGDPAATGRAHAVLVELRRQL
jgi:hypothetical protein